MTSITLCGRTDVGRRFCLSIHRRITTRMACRTLTIGTSVIHLSRLERDEVSMTGVALCSSRDMRRRFANTAVAG